MFKFNFRVEDGEIAEPAINTATMNKKLKVENQTAENGILSLEQLELAKSIISSDYEIDKNIVFKKIDLLTESNSLDHEEKLKEIICVDYVDSYKIKIDGSGRDENADLAEINKTHDLVAGKYEGGLKVWELSIDLARFIYKLNISEEVVSENGLDCEVVEDFKEIQNLLKKKKSEAEIRVVELGCGHSLPSLSLIRCLDDMMFQEHLKNPTERVKSVRVIVYLQDFNKQIVQDIASENLKKLMRWTQERWSPIEGYEKSPLDIDAKFVYGDWIDLAKDDHLLPSNYFDLILTSETIYNENNYRSLLNLFNKCLTRQDGLVLLSAKTCYFGCGGNLHEFLQLTRSTEYSFKVSKNLLYSHFSSQNSASSEQIFKNNSSYLTAATMPVIGKEIVKIKF